MKKLICADEVKAAAEKGLKIFCIDRDTIITPAAKDKAMEMGIEFSTDSSPAESQVQLNGGGLAKKVGMEKEINPDIIYQVVKAVLASRLMENIPTQAHQMPFHADCDSKSGLKIVRGRTVKLGAFDTGDPSTNVNYCEVVGKENSKMNAGFLTIEKSSFERELSDEEISIVLEGTLAITINGQTYNAHQGDVLFAPKGSKVTWSSPDYVKLFYVTCPANWAS